MDRYISRSEIYSRFFNGGNGVVRIHVSDIDVIPDADVAPVVHGRWVLEAEKGSCMDFHVKAHCSECGYEWFSKDGVGNYSSVFSAFIHGTDEDAISFVLCEASKRKLFDWCPVCGAKMQE